MPKRHRQPEPIEITPSSSGRRVASREFSQSCPEDDCPASPRENIEDYGDRLSDMDESYDSDEFHSSEVGDDGNGSSSTSDMSATVDGDTENDKNEDGENEDDDDEDDAGLINVEFGVFEMKVRDVNAVMHLMDQLCPDRMNEVDRDDLGAALQESPFTSVVKIGNDHDNDNDNDNDNDDEEEEIYGMASILDVAHGCDTHKKSLGVLLQLLKGSIWRTINPGILPTDILSSVDDATGKAKCVLLIGEYIRNVPLELTSYILTDMAQRFETMFGPKSSPAAESAGSAVCASFPCFFALLSKIQRAVDVPVTTTPQKADTQPLKKKRQHSPGHHQESEFDMRRYVFWREEDAVLYEYRDKRIATTAYRCRTQYDGQPENEIPLSILYVLPYGGLMQALAEVKKRESTQTNVVWY